MKEIFCVLFVTLCNKSEESLLLSFLKKVFFGTRVPTSLECITIGAIYAGLPGNDGLVFHATIKWIGLLRARFAYNFISNPAPMLDRCLREKYGDDIWTRAPH
ncbi:hypothetical protein IEQ34_009583 [Dendrobium chrysotoxum]|uniref:Uncharacterized protein n=1 Tax=Dendrobium chrysotoxum TaxID=161865 RepID=A0AAV7H394_DENCH|nr:hypothetical protein IEQ34_009583 [Dendrobium chrysotoxum]